MRFPFRFLTPSLGKTITGCWCDDHRASDGVQRANVAGFIPR